MEAKLPEDKLKKLREEVSQWLDCNHARKQEIVSLVGSLQHATKVVHCGRAFVSRTTAAKVKEMHFHTRLNLLVAYFPDRLEWAKFTALG